MTMREDDDKAEKKQSEIWTTWEDLLLSCAVHRYGLGDWSTIATELQIRVSDDSVNLFTAQICESKFNDLKHRFSDHRNDVAGEDDGGSVGGGDSTVPWLEELKMLRMAELRQIVHGRGLSIQSLNSKVKRLEEERERRLKKEEKPDLEKERSGNDKNDGDSGVLPVGVNSGGEFDGVSGSGERSERDNRSVNESNSTENRQNREKMEEKDIKPVQPDSVKHEPETKPVQTDSWNDSSKPSESKKAENESAKLNDSASKGDTGKNNNYEAQSSAKKSISSSSDGGGDKPVVSRAKSTTSHDSVKKSESLVRFLNLIRSNKHGSKFEVRLNSQETEEYKTMIRQHVDLEMVQTRITNGSYSSCTTQFYLDLLVLFNNAIVFFPKSSPESSAAIELRKLVLRELKKQRIKRQSNPSPESGPATLKAKLEPERSDPLLAKQQSTAPNFALCRKRSSITSKPSTSIKSQKQQDDKVDVIAKLPPAKTSSSSPNEDEESSLKLKLLKEKPVTGARSMRRSSNTRTNNLTITSLKTPLTNPGPPLTKGPSESVKDENNSTKGSSEAPKTEDKKKKNELLEKKRSAADFLKRIKKSSPAKETLLEALKSTSPENSNASNKREARDNPKKKVDDRKETKTPPQKGGAGGSGGGGKRVKDDVSPSKRNVGRPPKRGREPAPAPGKRGKEVEEVEAAGKRPNKKSKRIEETISGHGCKVTLCAPKL